MFQPTEEFSYGAEPTVMASIVAQEARGAKKLGQRKRKRRQNTTLPENKNSETVVVGNRRRKLPPPKLPRLCHSSELTGIKFIPWGTLDAARGSTLVNTCTIDNALMCLQAMCKWSAKVRDYFEHGIHEIAREIRNVLRLVEDENFFAAKCYWWERVAKESFRHDMRGSELELAKSPLDPLFAHFQQIFFCDEHGELASRDYNPCGPLLGNMKSYVARANSTDTDTKCLLDDNCSARKYKTLRPPPDLEHPHFLVFSGSERYGVRRDTLADIPVNIWIAGEAYNLLAVTLHKPGLSKASLGHYTCAFYRGVNEWVSYDGLKASFTPGVPARATVSTVWYMEVDQASFVSTEKNNI